MPMLNQENNSPQEHDSFLEAIKPYENKWVALVDDNVVASGDSAKEVQRNAEKAGYKEFAFYLVPSFKSSFAPEALWH
jgi:adenine/guanine phosphoribosyltransferase-like PRPP-binding protein